jgi:hypothetical protein
MLPVPCEHRSKTCAREGLQVAVESPGYHLHSLSACELRSITALKEKLSFADESMRNGSNALGNLKGSV